MEFIDTHCHIHFDNYKLDPEEVIKQSIKSGVTDIICVGCTIEDSRLAVNFASQHQEAWASIGLHPHDAKKYVNQKPVFEELDLLANNEKVIAIGETGLDYYYLHSSKKDQREVLEQQIEVALKNDLPIIFHVRGAFDDFCSIIDNFRNIRGVVHSFSDHPKTVEQILKRNLHIGLNGIMTFTKDVDQLEAAKLIPLEKLLLETDAPFLTPKPFRGKICEPKHVLLTAEFLSKLRGESLKEISQKTTYNARKLFGIN